MTELSFGLRGISLVDSHFGHGAVLKVIKGGLVVVVVAVDVVRPTLGRVGSQFGMAGVGYVRVSLGISCLWNIRGGPSSGEEIVCYNIIFCVI